MSLKSRIFIVLLCALCVLNPLFAREINSQDVAISKISSKLVISAANGADLTFANGLGRLVVKPNTLVGEIPDPYGITDKKQMALLEQFVIDWENPLTKPYAFDDSWNKVSSIPVQFLQDSKTTVFQGFTPQGVVWVVNKQNIYITDVAEITIPYTGMKSDENEEKLHVFAFDSESESWKVVETWQQDVVSNTLTILSQYEIASKYCIGVELIQSNKAASTDYAYTYEIEEPTEHFYESTMTEHVDTHSGALIVDNLDFTVTNGPISVDFVRRFNTIMDP